MRVEFSRWDRVDVDSMFIVSIFIIYLRTECGTVLQGERNNFLKGLYISFSPCGIDPSVEIVSLSLCCVCSFLLLVGQDQ